VGVNGQVLRVSDARSIGQVNADGRGVKKFADALHTLLGRYAGVVRKAVRALEVTTEHAETEGFSARVGVEEGLFLNGVKVQSAHIAPRHEQFAALVEPNPTDAGQPIKNHAPMSAGKTFHFVVVQPPIQFALPNKLLEDLGDGHLLRFPNPQKAVL
jgi:hypothetical protein